MLSHSSFHRVKLCAVHLYRGFVAICFFAFVGLSPAFAVDPDVQVINGPINFDVVITDQTANPKVIKKIDWSTIRFVFDGYDFTGIVLGLVGTPFFQLPTVTTSSVTIRIPVSLQFFAARVQVCYRSGLGGCGKNVIVFREPACSPEPACYEFNLTLETSESGTPGRWVSNAVLLPMSHPIMLETIHAVGPLMVGNPSEFQTSVWELEVWDSVHSFAADPQQGNVVRNFPLTILSATPVGNPNYRNYLVTLKVGSRGAYLPAGNHRIALDIDGIVYRYRETPTNLGADVFSAVTFAPLYYYWPTPPYQTGSAYLRLLGY